MFKLKNNTLEFFDSYEMEPDDELDYVSKKYRVVLHEDKSYLSKLLYECQYNIDYNEYKFQKIGEHIKTCRRHCVYRLNCRKMRLKDFAIIIIILEG